MSDRDWGILACFFVSRPTQDAAVGRMAPLADGLSVLWGNIRGR